MQPEVLLALLAAVVTASGWFVTYLLAKRRGRIENVDLVIVCERPKIGPHRVAMVAHTAEVLGLAEDQVSIKATTSERLGFTGRGEGITAQAVVSVALEG